MKGVMENYFEIQVWKSLRNAIENGHLIQVMEGDLLELAIEMADYDADIQKYIDSEQFSINSIMSAIEGFRRYNEKLRTNVRMDS